MATFLVPVDLGQNEIRNVVVQVLASAPGSPVAGQIYYDSTLGTLRQYTGAAWENLYAGKVPDGAIPLAKLATDPLARANHTGTQTAATISDFDTQVQTSRLDQMAAPTTAVAFNGQKATGLANGTADSDAATYRQVLDVAQNRDFKDSVRAATTANITLSGAQTIDGVSVVAGDRVLVKEQTAGADNGIYVAASGAWSRAVDFDSDADATSGAVVPVEDGTAAADSMWMLTTNGPITLGTTSLTFTQFGTGEVGTAGAGLTKTGSTYDVGAGTGITVNADDVAVDTGVVARKYTTTVGDGAATQFTVNHALANQWSTVQVFQNASPFAKVESDVELTDANNALVRFAVAPTSAQYRVVVTG